MSLFQRVKDAVMNQYSLSTLQKDIQNLKNNDPKSILKYVRDIDKFKSSDKDQAKATLQNFFWHKTNNNTYEPTVYVRFLTVHDLSMIILRTCGTQVAKFIFQDLEREIFSSYPLNDLIWLLQKHYSDRFALYIFNQFDHFETWTSEAIRVYLQCVSVDVMLTIYTYHQNVDTELRLNALLIYFKKFQNMIHMHQYVVILQAVIADICRRKITLFTLDDVYFLYTNNMMPTRTDLTVLFLAEMKRKHEDSLHEVKYNQDMVKIYEHEFNASVQKISHDESKQDGISKSLCKLTGDVQSLQLQYVELISANRKEVFCETLHTHLTAYHSNRVAIEQLQAENRRLKNTLDLQQEDDEVLSGTSMQSKEKMELIQHSDNDQLRDDEKEYDNVNTKNTPLAMAEPLAMADMAYEQWNTDDVLMWIMRLDNNRFRKYEEKLKENLQSECVMGRDLRDVDSGDVKGWGVMDFADRKYLLQQIQELVGTSRRGEDVEGAVTAVCDEPVISSTLL
eukprot:204694_1